MNIQQIPTDKIIPYARNPRKNDTAVDAVAASIKEFGFRQPIVVAEDMVVLVGHTRLKAAIKLGMAEVPVHIATGLTETQKKAYRIADNRTSELAEWDSELLALELEDLRMADFDLGTLAFEDGEINALLASLETTPEGETDADAVPEPQAEVVTQPGDVWVMGRHRLMCGDSTSTAAVALLMNGEKAQLIHADPPYGMGKEKDGVANDNLYGEKLDRFQMQWWAAFRPSLEDNASAYIWGNAPDLWRLWYRGGLADSERMTMRNEIVWDKGDGQGMLADGHRMFPTATERAVFFMLGEQGFNDDADNYWEGWEPVRAYLLQERDKVGWNNKIAAGFFGFHPRMADHWFSRSQWMFPQKEQYERLQKEANGSAFKRDYDDLKRDYDALKRDFYATRAYFDNTHDKMTDVWGFPRVAGEERHGHATPKPVDMIARAIKSSAPSGGLLVEPFSGSGTTIIAAEQTGRRCYAMELSPQYVDVAVRRWQQFTGKKATRESDGNEFPQC